MSNQTAPLSVSEQLFQARQLAEALVSVEQVLDDTTNDTAIRYAGTLLKAKIIYTKGKYEGKKTLFFEALNVLQDFDGNTDNLPIHLQIDVLITRSGLHAETDALTQAFKEAEMAHSMAQKNHTMPEFIEALILLSRLSVQKSDFQRAVNYANEALQTIDIEELIQNKKITSLVYTQLAQVYIRRQEYSKIMEYSEPLLRISRETHDIEREIAALNNIAVANGFRSDYKAAMENFLDALEKSKQIKYRYSIAQCLINIGTIYAHLFNYDNALDRYQAVLGEYSDTLNKRTMAIIYNNVGNIFYYTDRTGASRYYFKKALDLAYTHHFRDLEMLSLAQIGRTFTAEGKLPEAIEQVQLAQLLAAELGEINGFQINAINLATIDFQEKRFDTAIQHTEKGITAAKRMKDELSEIAGYNLLSKIYAMLGNFEKALNYHQLESKTQAAYSQLQRTRQIIDLDIKYAIKEKQAQIERLTQENKLQALLIQQSDQIATQNRQLLQANEELRQFAYIASHDLKEPLRMIGSYTQIIGRTLQKHLTDDTKRYFTYVNDGVIRLNHLLDAILQYATVGKTEEAIEPIDLTDIVQICTMHLKVRIEESSTEIHCEALPTVIASYSLLVQLMQNLIGNAVKFRKPECPSIVLISSEETEDEWIIGVQDNGIGIPKEFQDRIFVMFQRLHARTQYEGTGIGLSICQKIVQRLGGRMWLVSEINEGATFYFTLPKRATMA
jgi:signal transduction histidine kinase